MRRFALIATPVFLALAAANASALDAAQLLTKLTPSIYAVRAMGANNAPLASGSAVVIGPGNWSRLATCWPARARLPCGAIT